MDEKLSASQIYNADETGIFWRCIPRGTLAAKDEFQASGSKEAKERLTAMTCANASGTHKCKLLVIGKSRNLRCLKVVTVLPVIYRANKRAWITQDLTSEWFLKDFVPEVRENARKGLPDGCKVLLLLDNCSAYPPAELLVADNVYAAYLPPNCTSLIQPMDQGIIRSLKCYYRKTFLSALVRVECIKDF
ncbi:Uncharacterised protein at_DN0665, partial [Pycnogonum litorale]